MCPEGFETVSGDDGICYHLTPAWDTQMGCATRCASMAPNSQLACLATPEQNAFVLNTLLLAASRDFTPGAGKVHVWFGRFAQNTATGVSWPCTSGTHNNFSALPSSGFEKCLSLHSTLHRWSWAYSPCFAPGRCLCEISTKFADVGMSPAYEAFAKAERLLTDKLLADGRLAVLITYLVVLPSLSLLPFIISRCCRSYCRVQQSMAVEGRVTSRVAQARSAHSTTSQSPPPSRGRSIAAEAVIEHLRVAETAAKRVRERLSTALVFVGWTLFVVAIAPIILPFALPSQLYQAWIVLVGARLMVGQSLAPWSMGIVALSLRPIDVKGIQRASYVIYTLLILSAAGIVLSQANIFSTGVYESKDVRSHTIGGLGHSGLGICLGIGGVWVCSRAHGTRAPCPCAAVYCHLSELLR